MTEQHGEGQQHAADRIRAATTMQEILDTAASFEKTAMDFYTALAPKVSKRIRWLVEELAEEEKQHFDMFSELSQQADLEEQFQAMIIVP
ncbi:MAG: ferritin family protein, partial [Chromatiales bacterium]